MSASNLAFFHQNSEMFFLRCHILHPLYIHLASFNNIFSIHWRNIWTVINMLALRIILGFLHSGKYSKFVDIYHLYFECKERFSLVILFTQIRRYNMSNKTFFFPGNKSNRLHPSILKSPSSQASTAHEPRAPRCTTWIQKRQRNCRSNC